MRRFLIAILAFLLVDLCLVGQVWAQTYDKYRTRKLAEMARKLSIAQSIDTLRAGIHCGLFSYNGNSLTIVKRAGKVENIGFSVFPKELRLEQPSPVYDFIERYVLDVMLNCHRPDEVSNRLKLDRVTFEKGNLAMLPTLFADSTLSFGITNHTERAYSVEWSRGEDVVCRIFFPSNYELLRGSFMLENEERLRHDIMSHTSHSDSVVPPDAQALVEKDGVYVLDKGVNSIRSMRNQRFYSKAKGAAGTFVLVCSSRFPVESVANLFTGNDIANDFNVEIRQLKYNFKKDTYNVKLSQLVGFCLDEGCRPYFGVVGYNEASGDIDAVVEMRNHQQAYEHLMRVRMNVKDLDTRKGNIKVSLTGYVMTHDIEELYNDMK